jgi:hypothetical protein
LKKHENDITDDSIKKVVKYFEKGSNPAVVFIFECLVGVMRGVQRSDADSVKLYLRTYEGFKLALNRVDPAKIDPHVAKTMRDKIITEYDKTLFS